MSEPCKACEHRRARGFEGQCPACAADRARAEIAAEREGERPASTPAALALVYFAAVDSLRVLEQRQPRSHEGSQRWRAEMTIARQNLRRAENNLRGAVGAPLLPDHP